jgi:hypothetical protein
MQSCEQFILSFRERGNRQAINTGTALVLPDMLPGFGQIAPIIDLVDQRMDFPVPLVSSSSSANRRLRGILDAGAGSFALRTYPHFRHVLARSSSFGSVPQYGAFPLRTAFWVRPASPFNDDDPRPFALISFKSTAPRSDSWHRFGRNFARAYIRAYRRMASGWALLSPLLALSSASVALFQPYLSAGRYQASLSHRRIFPTVSPAHTLVRRSGTQMPSPP